MASAHATVALAPATRAVGLDLQQLADIVKQPARHKSIVVDGVRHLRVGLALGQGQPHRTLGHGDGVLDEVDAPGVGQEREGHLLQILHTLPTASLTGHDPYFDDFGAQPFVADLGQLSGKQLLDIGFVDHD